MRNKLWVLTDDRPGNNSQSLGLAHFLLPFYEEKKISYNGLSKLPNFICSKFSIISKQNRKEIFDFDPPDVIISTGRKAANVALYIKSFYKDKKIILIQIMNPNFCIRKFDFVILPSHDRNFKSYKNVVYTVGALNKIGSFSRVNIGIKLKKCLPKKENKILLLIGGASKNRKFSKSELEEFIKSCSKVALNMDAILIVMTSRRTSNESLLIIKKNLSCKNILYDWNKMDYNPYPEILDFVNYIIVTGDSISMCSEALTSKKSVYIYNFLSVAKKKHIKFHNYIFKNEYAKRFKLNLTHLNDTSLNSLNETERVASIVDRKYQLHKRFIL